MSDRAKVIDKVRKILSRTQSSNANEAAAAAALAAKLMRDNALSETDVTAEVGDPGDMVTEVVVGSDGFMAPWRFALVFEVSRAFFCDAIALRIGQRRKVRIIGRKDDAEVAMMVFKHLVKEIERLADDEMCDPDVLFNMHIDNLERFVSVGDSPSSETARGYKDSFRRGAVIAIAWRLKNEFEEFARSSEKALVLVEKRHDEAKQFRINKYGQSRELGAEDAVQRQSTDEYAVARGYAAGMDMPIPGKETPGKPEQRKLSGGKKP